jgi:nucleotide-binding universal stress UspA family protein
MTTRVIDLIDLDWPVDDPWTGLPDPPHPTEGGGSDPTRILVPYNGTSTAQVALDVASTLSLGRSTMVWVLYIRSLDVGRAGRFCFESEDEAQWRVQTGVAELRRRGVSTSAVVRDARRERVPHTIVAEAERRNAGCIVMGTRARRAFSTALLGSTSLAVARRSTIPTILVKAPKPRRLRRPRWRAPWSPRGHARH